MKHRNNTRIIGFVLAVLLLGLVIFGLTNTSHQDINSKKINVVAAENFWGSLVGQIGGNKVNVFSVVSDPNADPHEYESNASDARAVENANYVIANGAGYDSWINKLLSASPNSNRKELDVASFLGIKTGGNPHLWYSPVYVNKTVKKMELNLIAIKPSDKAYFTSQYNKLVANLTVYQNKIKLIAKDYSGTKVSATEDIFYYLAVAAKLNLISPDSFTEAVAEGNDPPASSVVTFQSQLNSKKPKVLVYNKQTVTPLTTSIRRLAASNGIPVVGVTETIQPPQMSFEKWMNMEIDNLYNALRDSNK
jgi:zinc/manganese transport system substrate-binding protein